MAGRPRIQFDMRLVEALARIQCTRREMAATLGVGLSTLEDRITKDPRFREVVERGQSAGCASLRRRQFEMAMNGNTGMAIWLGKQYLEQSDKLEQKQEIDITETSPREKIESRIKEIATRYAGTPPTPE